MKLGICSQLFIPMRSEPSESVEMVSQVLFGELFELLEDRKEEGFALIRLLYDDYTGWIDRKTIIFPEPGLLERILEAEVVVLQDIHQKLVSNEGSFLLAGAGASVFVNANDVVFPSGYKIEGDFPLIPEDRQKIRQLIISNSMKWLEIPYLWGGRSTGGVDCSGFVHNIFKQVGIPLPRDAKDQVGEGTTVNFHSETKAGDLAFFDKPDGRISHVGILDGKGQIIHSSGKVRIDRFDQQGIYSGETGNYSHHLRIIKNVID